MDCSEIFVAVDPGKTGSASFFQGENLIYSIAFKEGKDWAKALSATIQTFSVKTCYIENTHAFARDGRKSAHTFGLNKGKVLAVLELHNVKVVPVEIQAWPLALGLPKRREIENAKKRRQVRRADQEARAKDYYPKLANVEDDIWASVLIGRACLIMESKK